MVMGVGQGFSPAPHVYYFADKVGVAWSRCSNLPGAEYDNLFSE